MEASQAVHLTLLEEIARDLSGEPSFPTCMDAATLIRDTLKDPEASLERVCKAISIDPLIASKVLRVANTASRNPSGKPVTGLTQAVSTLGFECVRTISLAVALDQMLKIPKLAAFASLAKRTWNHSLHQAAIARARRLGCINPDEAMLSGLVSHIGVFYLLYRAADKTAYQQNEALLVHLLQNHHLTTGVDLLQALSLPERIIKAIQNPFKRENPETPGNLHDVLYFAELLTNETLPWDLPEGRLLDDAEIQADRALYANLLEEAAQDIAELHAALA